MSVPVKLREQKGKHWTRHKRIYEKDTFKMHVKNGYLLDNSNLDKFCPNSNMVAEVVSISSRKSKIPDHINGP